MRYWISLVAVALFATTSNAQTFTFTAGNVIVERFNGDANYGAGGAPLAAPATASFLDQFLPNVANQALPVNTAGANLSIAMPTTVGTSGNPLAATVTGNATSEGAFSRTVDGFNLVVPGYNVAIGGTTATASPATANRSLSLVSSAGINSTNGFSDGGTGNNRSSASVDGSNIYMGLSTSLAMTTASGTVTTTTPIIAAANCRVVHIVNNSLFVTSASASPGIGISLIGTAGTLPTAIATPTLLPGTATSGTGTPSPYGFALFNNPLNANNWNGTGLDTLYIADDRTSANGGGIQRWVFDGTNWILDATITQGTIGARGLAASFDSGTNTVSLFATGTVSSANNLFTLTDTLTGSVAGGNTGGLFSAITTLATSPVNTVFRGVDFTPVPEPAAVLAICAGAGWLGGIVVRRRMNRKKAD